MEITEGHTAESLSGLHAEWDALLVRCSHATIYQTWEWNEAWWSIYKAGKRLRLLSIRLDGRLVGIAPFYVSRHLGTPVRRLAFLGTGASDYLDMIADDEVTDLVLLVINDFLHRAHGFDFADLQQLSLTPR